MATFDDLKNLVDQRAKQSGGEQHSFAYVAGYFSKFAEQVLDQLPAAQRQEFLDRYVTALAEWNEQERQIAEKL
jgi:hypothetical protein